jgi:hypothetical protein
MRRRPTIHEIVWPKDSTFIAVKAWPDDFIATLLLRVWTAFDHLASNILSLVQDWSDLEHLERSLTDLHFDHIVALQSGDDPFLPTREVPVFESRQSSQAMPPSNDFGFKIRGGDLSLVWPLEAKVIGEPLDVGRYVEDLSGKYLACRSSPFSPEAGLIGYKLDDQNEVTFNEIASRLGQQLSVYSPCCKRPHRTSEHHRIVPMGKPYPIQFRCHHLLMNVTPTTRSDDQ